jgi:hypothetical protein
MVDHQLPVELWIKIFRHIADLERYPPRAGYPLLPATQSLAYDTPTTRSLCLTSKYFYDIALPLRCEDTSIYYSQKFAAEPRDMSRRSIFSDSRIPLLIRTLRWINFVPEAELHQALSAAIHVRSLILVHEYLTLTLGDVIGIPCLYNVTYLELYGLSYTIDATDLDFSRLNLRTLALRGPVLGGGNFSLIDNLYKFP